MDIHDIANRLLTSLLATSLVVAPCQMSAFVEIDDLELHVQQLGIKNKINKIIKGVLSLNGTSGRRNMVITAAKFKKDLDDWVGSGVTLTQAMELANAKLIERGIRIDRRHLNQLLRVLSLESGALSVDSYEPLAKQVVAGHEYDIIEMPDMAILGVIQVLCGSLLCITQIPICVGLGGELIATGIGSIIVGYSQDNKK